MLWTKKDFNLTSVKYMDNVPPWTLEEPRGLWELGNLFTYAARRVHFSALTLKDGLQLDRSGTCSHSLLSMHD